MKIKKITLENFKRWKKLEINFNKVNEFYAENGGGKTSIFQAYLWCLGFETENIFPKEDSVIIEGLEPKVELVLEINGIEHTYTRTSKPLFIIDDLKIKTKKVYVETICNQVGISQKQLEMLCNTYLFNQDTNKWGWVNRFAMLNELLHFTSKPIKYADNYEVINKYILNYKTPIEIAKILRDRKKSINNNKEFINGEITNLKTQLGNNRLNFDEIEKEINKYKNELRVLQETQISIKNKDKEKLKKELDEIQEKIRTERKKHEAKKNDMAENVKSLDMFLKSKEATISKLTNDIDNLTKNIESCENEAICSLCGGKLPEEKVQNLKNKMIEERTELLNHLDKEIEFVNGLEEQKSVLLEPLPLPSVLQEYEQEQTRLLEKLALFDDDNEEELAIIETDIMFINEELATLKEQLFRKTIVKELEEQLEGKNKELRDLLEDFSIQAKGEEELNHFFKLVEKEYEDLIHKVFGEEISFKFFTLKKDGEYNQDCFVRRNIKGLMTSYNEMSLGERLKTDIITSLGFQKLLEVEIPIWVDNAQDMTDDIPSCENQIIILNTSKTINNLKGEFINGI